jgi:hypothetical protein
VGVVWLVTGALVLHPHYRTIGATELSALGLPVWLMPLTCGAELALGLRVVFGRPSTWLVTVQVALVIGFTAILGATQPMLLVHPYGVLTKNVPLLAALVAAWWADREGWSVRAFRVLRAGMAVIWITEGLFPKILFQQPTELLLVEQSGLVPMDASFFLVLLGAAQILAGALALGLSGRPLRVLWGLQAAALVALPLLVTLQNPLVWVHPFGPLLKNVPIVVGTALLALRGEVRAC